MSQTARYHETLRRLAMIDEGFIEDDASLGLDLAKTSTLEPKTAALLQLGILVATGSPAVCLEWSAARALAAGATDEMTSVDEDDQLIYIEVKSTKSADPTEAFCISHAELIEATYRRSRFYIYRVTDVDAAVPSITRWADPLGLIKEGKGRLLLAKARMALTLDEEADDAEER